MAASVGYRSSDVYATLLVIAAYVLFGIATLVAATVAATRSPARLLLTTFADQARFCRNKKTGRQERQNT
jgi:hypothetical protein